MKMFDSGKKFGLQPIGTSGIDESAPKNDSTRSAFPALATKGSVFNWNPSLPALYVTSSTATGTNATINLRKNTAVGGTSVDVPTWAAGALVIYYTIVNAIGVGVTWQSFLVTGTAPFDATILYQTSYSAPNFFNIDQIIIPFFDQPEFSVAQNNDLGTTTGSVGSRIYLLGFVRNV